MELTGTMLPTNGRAMWNWRAESGGGQVDWGMGTTDSHLATNHLGSKLKVDEQQGFSC
jgi:hypothetical protein